MRRRASSTCWPYARARRAATGGASRRARGSRREAGRDRDWQGGLWSRSLQARLVRVCSYDLSKCAAAPPRLVGLTRARGAPPREEPAAELGGPGARPAAIEIGRGGFGLAHCRRGSLEFVVMIYRNAPPRLLDLLALRAREARRHGRSQ